MYHAEDQASGLRPVLVKELLPCAALGISAEEVRDRFDREVRVLSTISHPAVPRLLEHFREGDTWFIILEFFGGETLDSLSLKRTTPFPPRFVVQWGIELTGLLALFHHQVPEPIIFRDIRPSNIIVTPENEVRLADFGITRFFNPLKVKDTFVMGTAGFSPPEQYGKEQSDRRSDIFSLGATLFYLLTLRTPEECGGRLPNLSKLNAAVPPSLDRIIRRCMEKDRSRRFQTVEELEKELKEIKVC